MNNIIWCCTGIIKLYRIYFCWAGLEEFDSAFDFTSQDESRITLKKWEDFPTLDIRDAFMVFMIDLIGKNDIIRFLFYIAELLNGPIQFLNCHLFGFIGEYQKYMIPPCLDLRADTYRTLKEEFALQSYLDDADVALRGLLELLLETQMFAGATKLSAMHVMLTT